MNTYNGSTFKEAEAFLAGKGSRSIANNTRLERREDGSIAVRLHATDVVTYRPDGSIVLESGGWRTVTTKDRMCRYLPAPWRVYSERGVWGIGHVLYLDDGSRGWVGYRFHDGLELDKTEDVVDPEPFGPDPAERATLKAIAAYVKLVRETFAPRDRSELAPGPGDCWFCCMVTENGTTLGDASGNHDHLREHLTEGYVVPSLVFHALQEAGYRSPEAIYLYGSADSIGRAVRRYVKTRLLPESAGSKPVGVPANTATGFAVAS